MAEMIPGMAPPRPRPPAPLPEPEEPPRVKEPGVFEVGDLVRISGQTAKLWHVTAVDPEREGGAIVRLRPDCGCGGDAWAAPDMLYHSS